MDRQTNKRGSNAFEMAGTKTSESCLSRVDRVGGVDTDPHPNWKPKSRALISRGLCGMRKDVASTWVMKSQN